MTAGRDCPPPIPRGIMVVRFQWKHHPCERVESYPEKRSWCAGPRSARWRTGVTHRSAAAAVDGWLARVPGGRRLARSLAVLGLVASSAGCILTKDLPDPALDDTRRLQGRPALDRHGRAADARLVARFPFAGTDRPDGRGADRQSGHRRRHRAVQAGRCAGAYRRRGAVAEPQRHRAGGLFTHLGIQFQRPDQWRPRGGQLFGLAQRQLRARFLGQEPRRRAGGGRDRRRHPLRSRRRRADDADHRRQRLFPGAGGAGPASHRAAQHCQRRAHPQCHQGAAPGRHRQRSRRRAAGERGRQPARAGAAAAADARSEHQRAGDAGLAAAGSGARHRRLAQQDRLAARHARPAVGTADAASGYPPPGIPACFGDRQCRQRPRAVLSRAFN